MQHGVALRVALGMIALASTASIAAAGPGQQYDPFVKPVDKKKVAVAVPKESVVEPPSFEARLSECRQATGGASSVTEMPCAYLVRELKLTGVFRSDGAVEAFLAAAPSKATIVVHEGDRLYDGRVVSIREPDSTGGALVVLEKTTTKRVGKKVVTSTAPVRLTIAGETAP